MARPNKGLGHVEDLEGDPDLKWQLQIILSTILGQLSVEEACNELGIGVTYFGMLRTRALQGALAGLAPRPTGRKKGAEPSPTETAALERVAALEHENKILRAQLELEVLKRAGPDRPKRQGRRAPRQEPPS